MHVRENMDRFQEQRIRSELGCGSYSVGKVLSSRAHSPGFDPQHCMKLACWHTPVIPTLGGDGRESGVQDDPRLHHKFKAGLGYSQ